MNRSLAVALLCLLAAGPAAAQERVTSVADLQFYSSFWMNLHHRLHADARDKKNRVDASRWSAEDRAAWNTALEFYARELAQRDLRTGKDMTIISGRLSGAAHSSPRWDSVTIIAVRSKAWLPSIAHASGRRTTNAIAHGSKT